MSVGSNNLQEMENAVTKGAAKADAMPSLTGTTPGQTGSYEDLVAQLHKTIALQMIVLN